MWVAQQRDMKAIASVVLGCAVIVYAGPALACGVSPNDYSFESISPSDGTREFPRNGAILARFELDPKGEISGSARPALRVVRVDTGEVAAGTLATERVSAGVHTWAPDAPLAPNVEYRIEVTAIQPGSSDAKLLSSTVFKTSHEITGELRLEGRLRVAVRLGTAPQCRGTTSCGTCVEIGERPGLFAEVELPQVSGGFDAHGYAGSLTLNGDAVFVTKEPERPESRITVQSASLQPNMANTLSWELRRSQRPYQACFGFNVSDPSGHSASAEEFCISESEVQAAFAELDASNAQPASDTPAIDKPSTSNSNDEPDMLSASAADDTDATGESSTDHASANCSATPGQTPRAAPAIALALMSLLRVSRRRKRPAR